MSSGTSRCTPCSCMRDKTILAVLLRRLQPHNVPSAAASLTEHCPLHASRLIAALKRILRSACSCTCSCTARPLRYNRMRHSAHYTISRAPRVIMSHGSDSAQLGRLVTCWRQEESEERRQANHVPATAAGKQ